MMTTTAVRYIAARPLATSNPYVSSLSPTMPHLHRRMPPRCGCLRQSQRSTRGHQEPIPLSPGAFSLGAPWPRCPWLPSLSEAKFIKYEEVALSVCVSTPGAKFCAAPHLNFFVWNSLIFILAFWWLGWMLNYERLVSCFFVHQRWW
jgi:hypothetical protein